MAVSSRSVAVSEIGTTRDGRSLSVLIEHADRERLLTLVQDELLRFSHRDVLQALRSPHCDRLVVEEIAAARSIMSARTIRKAIALHPRAPRHLSLRCLDDLGWRDLLDIGREVRVAMPVRRAANRKIAERWKALAVGEKISLARFADRELVRDLLAEPDTSIFSALLKNPRLLAEDLVTWITVGAPAPAQLVLLSQDPVWSRRWEVRSALLRSKSLPRPAALALLPTGSRLEWKGLIDDPAVDPLVAACAETLYESRGQLVDRRGRQG